MDLREFDWLVVRCLDQIASRILTFTDPVDQDCIEEAKRWMGWYIKNANKIDGKVTETFRMTPVTTTISPMINNGIMQHDLYGCLFYTHAIDD
ncbi:MAG: hypothetical protein WD572_11555 [Gammaproteobacteria bacterium]